MSEPPIACSLDGRQTSDRQAVMARLWAHALMSTEPTAAGLRACLRDSPGIEGRVRELIEAESRCCAFLAFDLTRHEDRLVLDISGPADARPVIESFFAGAPA